MINKLKIGFLIAVLSLAVGVSSANAADITFSNDFTVNLSGLGGGTNFTIVAGSTATAPLTVTATTLTVTVPAGETFGLIAPGQNLLTNDLSLAQNCSSSSNSVTITGLQTVVFTPSATLCTPPAGGGGLSGGGSGGASGSGDITPPSGVSVNINAGASTVASLTTTLDLAATGATQMMISNDVNFTGASWETYTTSKSWLLSSGDGVKTVYVKFRDAAGNVSATVSDTITVSGSGTVTITITPPTTVTVLTTVVGCGNRTTGFSTATGESCVNNYINVTGGTLITGCDTRTSGFSTTSGVSCVGNGPGGAVMWYDLGSVTLRNGSSGAAVMELQRFLNRFLNLGLVIDGKLGPKTIAVIKKWQASKGLVADGLVGPKTKAMMNAQAQIGY